MDHTSNSRQTVQAFSAPSNSRRSFMRYLSMGSVALAVQACGGGGGADGATAPLAPSAPAPAPVPVAPAPSPAPAVPAPSQPVAPAPAPVWLSIPTIAFTQGVQSSFSVADYITTANVAAYTVTLNASPLPAGVTFNSVTRSFDYDGRGGVVISDGHVLTAVGA
jgi:hypothetical protein